MKFIFPIIAILVCGAAAYFSLSTSEKFEKVQAERLESLNTNKAVTANAEAAETNIEKEKELLETAKNNLEVATQSVLALESTGNSLKNEASKLDNELKIQNDEFAELANALEQVQAGFAELGEDIDMDNLGDKIAEIGEEVEAKRAKSEELDTLIESAKKSLASKQKDAERLASRKVERTKRIARNSMEARVTAVNQDWGFLVIGAGSNSGFTPQTSLLIKRDGRLLGRVKPSAIEPTQTIAEIDLETLSPGVRIQPGDRVILAKPSSN
ncbi:hypothetical protein ACFSSA_13300 [Luteolibacter algae]|uniref:Chromosome partition protein Smc n=1 Tax=Luteolibacter algae TaxID=454151 RepID=A0ABW5D968_9BACT